MPYNPGTGIYTLPAIYLAIPGTTIIAAQHNQPLEDLEVANNYARPIVAGGTGANSLAAAQLALNITPPITEITPGAVVSSSVTGIPAWATEIDIQLTGLSLNGATALLLHLGDAGGLEATGYTNTFATLKAGAVANTSSTTSFLLSNALATSSPNGLIQLRRVHGTSFQWNMVFQASDGDTVFFSSGTKALSAALDRFRLSSANGTSTFDAGTFSYKWR